VLTSIVSAKQSIPKTPEEISKKISELNEGAVVAFN
jgi:hypothetical protein